MDFAFWGFICSAIYGILFCLPIKIKISRKRGFYLLSYEDLQTLLKNGDLDAIKLRKRTKIMLFIAALGVACDFFYNFL